MGGFQTESFPPQDTTETYQGEHNMDKNQVFSFITGLLSGSIVGVAAVVLLTPRSGLETRQGIADKINEIIDAGRQATLDRRQELQEEYRARIQIPLQPLDREGSEPAGAHS